MLELYFLAIVSTVVGFIMSLKLKRITYTEWIVSSVLVFLLAIILHAASIAILTRDYETWSGQIEKSVFYPEWVEKYKTAVYKSVTKRNSDGTTAIERVFSHYETHYRTHYESYVAETTLDNTHSISKEFFNEIKQNFNNLTTEDYYKSGFHSGDPNIYVSYNISGYIYPVTCEKFFRNNIKASKNVFSFADVPADINLYDYPKNDNWRQSDRLINENGISILEFDRMNARLGPRRKVNVIMINFGNKAPMFAQYQQAKWVNGKKNDLVICYGYNNTNILPSWAFVFGWSESEQIKRDVESIILKNKVDNNILPLIENRIIKGYVKKEWDKFNYISVDIPTNIRITFVVIFVIINIGTYLHNYYNLSIKRA